MIAEFDNFRFKCRGGTTDWNTFYACAVADEYGVKDLDLGGRLVYDIGAHAGGFSVLAASLGASVVAVEPLPENVALLEVNAQLNGFRDRIAIVRAAVGADAVGYGPADDAHRYIGNMTELGRRVPVTRVTIRELVRQFGRETPYLVKLDCEGGEWDALLEPELSYVPLIVGEWHPVHGHTRADVERRIGFTHSVTFTGPKAGPGGFRAVRRVG